MSVALPAANGTMTLTGLEGYLSCACAGRADDGDDRQQSQIDTFHLVSSLSASWPALVPAIHALLRLKKGVDARHKAGA